MNKQRNMKIYFLPDEQIKYITKSEMPQIWDVAHLIAHMQLCD